MDATENNQSLIMLYVKDWYPFHAFKNSMLHVVWNNGCLFEATAPLRSPQLISKVEMEAHYSEQYPFPDRYVDEYA
jgi:hypothetical protein